MNSKFITIGKRHIHFLEKGSGKTIVFITGVFNTSTHYEQLGNELSSTYHILIPDLNKGATYGGGIINSIDQYVKVLSQFLRELKVSDPYLVGISMGGLITYRYYELFPRKLKGMFLVNTPLSEMKWKPTIKKTSSFLKNTLIQNHNQRITGDGGFLSIFRHPRQFIKDTKIIKEYRPNLSPINVKNKVLIAQDDEFIDNIVVEELKTIEHLDVEVVNGNHNWFLLQQDLFLKEITSFVGSEKEQLQKE